METIRLNIAGRVYPLSVPAEEAEGLRAAAEAVSHQVEAFRKQYQVQDRGDLLAMTALQFATRPAEHQAAETAAISEENERRLNDLLARMDAALTGS
jgi:cell division protein ZapA